MKINGTATVAAPAARVWEALRDPAVLVRTIPGCERLETVDADTYDMTINAGVASIRGTYVGRVALREPDPPRSFVLRARGQGAPGTVDATVVVRLAEDGGATTVSYDADTVVGGMIGGVGQRMIGAAARRTAAEFFTAVDRLLAEPAPAPDRAPAPAGEAVPAAAAGAPGGPPAAGAGTVYTVPPRPPRQGADAWATATAFGAGGVVALAGVVIGYLIGRRRPRA
jgi:carbon monoxide dehydrogenase subunit G